jgi:Tfp pilus assembly protein PilE
MVGEYLSELEKMLERAQTDEKYRRDNKNYLEETKRLYDEISKKSTTSRNNIRNIINKNK